VVCASQHGPPPRRRGGIVLALMVVASERAYPARMWRAFGGATPVIAGIAAFTEASRHRPPVHSPPRVYADAEGIVEVDVAVPKSGLSQTAYDLLRIGAWALVIVGGLLVIVGLVGYWAAQRDVRA
jgi:hypothetical protein